MTRDTPPRACGQPGDHLDRGAAISVPVGLCELGVHDERAAVLDQQMPQVGELRPGARGLAVHARLGVGVESTGSFGAALTRSLVDQGCRVIEVNQPHPHLRSRRAKNDAIDAEAAVRKVLSGEATPAATDTTGIVEAIRQLSITPNSAVKARAAALCQLGDLLVTAPAALRNQLDTRRTPQGTAAVCARLRPDTNRLADPAQAANPALRSLGRRVAQLGGAAAELGRRLDRLVATAAPTTLSRLGCGTHHTATLLVAAGHNIDRLSSQASFAHLCAAAPVPASSGRTNRHRPNFAANRDANRALHMTVIVRLRYCERTRGYTERRLAQGKTKKEGPSSFVGMRVG